MKPTCVVLLALLCAAPLRAQQSAAAAANPITAAFRGRTMALQRNLAQAFDSIPESKFAYKPTPAQLTIGDIAQHLANDNYAFCESFGEMKATRAAEDTATADSVKGKWPKAKLVAKLKESFDFCTKAFAQLQDSNLADSVTLSYEGRTFHTSRASMALGHALDMADHYSQIANYMRLNGILPPTALPRPRQSGE
ncbi:MAG TPA: DinB family protein [Gemmatimonadaceae bacterium]|nr:DinB family protein [Gemmatimonadaceae bacterium]